VFICDFRTKMFPRPKIPSALSKPSNFGKYFQLPPIQLSDSLTKSPYFGLCPLY
jgi:hypothetical protein